MTAKEWLRSYAAKDLRMEALMEEASRLWDKATALSNAMGPDKIKGGNADTSRLASTVAAMVDKQNALQQEAQTLLEELTRIEAAVDAVQDDKQQALLRLHYVCGWTWERIARKMRLDVRWVYRLHGRALRHVKVPDQDQ